MKHIILPITNEELINKYSVQLISSEVIAKECGVCRGTIVNRLRKLKCKQVKVRASQEIKKCKRDKYLQGYNERNKDKLSKYRSNYYENHKEEHQDYNKLHYILNRDNVLERTHKRNIEKAPQISAQKSTKHKAEKIEVLTHYGNGKCVCIKCGFTDIRALSIDHIDGSGAEKRDVRRSTGVNLYGWLKRNNYPEGYQTLCMSCQAEKKILNREQTRGKPLNPLYAQQRSYQKQLKFDAINKYSGGQLTCIKCGCNNMETLSIDHVNGDGAQHKRERGMDNLYLWLRNNNYPIGYQCICMNCQYIKRSENNEHTKPKKKEVMLLV